MFYFLTILSFFIYSFLVLKLFITSLMSSISMGQYLVSFLKFLIICFLLYEIYIEWRVYLVPKKKDLLEKKWSRKELLIFMCVLGGTLCAYFLNYNLALGAVVASGLVGLIGGLLLPSYAVPIYCGSFAGMVSSYLVTDVYIIVVIGIFAGLLYTLGSETFKGFGGKLGATAYFGTLSAAYFFGNIEKTMVGGGITIQYDVFIVLLVGALGTYWIEDRYKIGVVVASSLLGLTFGLILPNMFFDGYGLSVALFCGTFIGMSTTSKLSSKLSVVTASVIGAIVYLYTAPYFAGLGGKLGLIAFGSSIVVCGGWNFFGGVWVRFLEEK